MNAKILDVPGHRALRYYAVCDKSTGVIIALINAVSVAQARSHWARKTVEVSYAEQKDLMEAMKAGIEPESVVESDDGGEAP